MIPECPYPIMYDQFDNLPVTRNDILRSTWEEGFSSLAEWLFEPCTEHIYLNVQEKTDGSKSYYHKKDGYGYYKYRYQCPECMAELRGRLEEWTEKK